MKLSFRVNDGPEHVEVRDCGLLPIMVRVRPSLPPSVLPVYQLTLHVLQSSKCNLRNLTAAQLVAKNEEAEEFGGYFIINGNERLVRYLILPRRNHVVALERSSFAKRGPSYTSFGVTIRCVKPDQSGITNTLHYLANGGAMLRFSWHKQEYLIPVVLILKALVSVSDREIFEGVMMGEYDNTFLTDRVELLLRSFKTFKLFTGEDCLEYLGDKFRVVLGLPADWLNVQIGQWLLNKLILVHLDSSRDKYRLLLCASSVPPFCSC